MRTKTDIEKSEEFQSWMRGFRDGVGSLAMREDFMFHKKEHIKYGYITGYEEGRTVMSKHSTAKREALGMGPPNLLRMQTCPPRARAKPETKGALRRGKSQRGFISPGCRADDDGDCRWDECPQLSDGEPHKTGRHCPRDIRSEEL